MVMNLSETSQHRLCDSFFSQHFSAVLNVDRELIGWNKGEKCKAGAMKEERGNEMKEVVFMMGCEK